MGTSADQALATSYNLTAFRPLTLRHLSVQPHLQL